MRKRMFKNILPEADAGYSNGGGGGGGGGQDYERTSRAESAGPIKVPAATCIYIGFRGSLVLPEPYYKENQILISKFRGGGGGLFRSPGPTTATYVL